MASAWTREIERGELKDALGAKRASRGGSGVRRKRRARLRLDLELRARRAELGLDRRAQFEAATTELRAECDDDRAAARALSRASAALSRAAALARVGARARDVRDRIR